MATSVGMGRQPRLTVEEATQRLISTIEEEFTDPVTREMMQRVGTLPCGHNIEETMAVHLLTGPRDGRRCPLDREPFEAFIPNTAIQNVVNAWMELQRAISAGPTVEAMAQLERAALNSPSMEATAHFERGKRFADQGNYEQAVQACLAAITFSPDYGKAHAYLHFLLDQQQRPPVPQDVEASRPNQNTEPLRNSSANRAEESRGSAATTRPLSVPARSAASEPVRATLVNRVSSVPARSQPSDEGITGAVGQYFWANVALNKFILGVISEAVEPVGAYVGERIYNVGTKVGLF